MNCSKKELIKTCQIFLQKFDDYEQESCELVRSDLSEYFSSSFNELEIEYKKLKKSVLKVTDVTRNRIRVLIKETEKMAFALTDF